MKPLYFTIALTLFTFSHVFCQNDQQPHYELDHIILFVKDDRLQRALDQILTSADKLETVHAAQGTRGVYYLFLNGFLELLYLEDAAKAAENEARFKSHYTQRWNESAGAGIAFGLKMQPFDTAKITFAYELYHSLDAPDDEFYIMMQGNKDLRQPLVFLTMPHRAHKVLESLEEVNQKVRPEIRADVIQYLTHPAGIHKITDIVIKLTQELHASENIQLLSGVESFRVQPSDQFQIIFTFDHAQQDKTFTINNFIQLKY